MVELAAVGWGNSSPAFRQVFAARFLPDATPAEWQAFDELQRNTATPDVTVRYLRTLYGMNVKQAAAQVRCPTLVLHGNADPFVRIECGHDTAERIPGARFVAIEGGGHDLAPAAFDAYLVHLLPFLRAHPITP